MVKRTKNGQETFEMIQKYKFVEKNIDMIRTLTRNGYISPKLLTHYHVYNIYSKMKDASKMKRYQNVAKETGLTPYTVRRAISDMKAYVKN